MSTAAANVQSNACRIVSTSLLVSEVPTPTGGARAGMESFLCIGEEAASGEANRRLPATDTVAERAYVPGISGRIGRRVTVSVHSDRTPNAGQHPYGRRGEGEMGQVLRGFSGYMV